MRGFSPHFLPREHPLDPVAVAIPRARASRLLPWTRGEHAASEPLRALVSSTHLLLFGPAITLPWVDGAQYLGHDAEAPRLFVPTAVTPDLPYALLERALYARRPAPRAPAALLLDPLRLVDAASPGTFDPDALARWIEPDSRS